MSDKGVCRAAPGFAKNKILRFVVAFSFVRNIANFFLLSSTRGDSGRKGNGPILVAKKWNLVFYHLLVCFCHCIFGVSMQIDQNRPNFLKFTKPCPTFTASMSRRCTGQNMGFHGLCQNIFQVFGIINRFFVTKKVKW